MIFIDCALQIKRTQANAGAITDVQVNVGPLESDGDRLESAVFAGKGDGAKNMLLILTTEQGLEFGVHLSLPNGHAELELAHYWTNTNELNVALLPEGQPEPYPVTRRTLPLESFFSETAAFDLARVVR